MIAHRDPLWAEKYGTEDHGDDTAEVDVTIAGMEIGKVQGPDDTDHEADRAVHKALEDSGAGIVMPNPSFWPFISASGLLVWGLGMLIDGTHIFSLGPVEFGMMAIVGFVLFLVRALWWPRAQIASLCKAIADYALPSIWRAGRSTLSRLARIFLLLDFIRMGTLFWTSKASH